MEPEPVEFRADNGFRADERNRDLVLTRCGCGTFDRRGRCKIAAHGIDGDAERAHVPKLTASILAGHLTNGER